jgi:hypothetical protein
METMLTIYMMVICTEVMRVIMMNVPFPWIQKIQRPALKDIFVPVMKRVMSMVQVVDTKQFPTVIMWII